MSDPLDPRALRRRIADARPPGMSAALRGRARKLLLAWFDTAARRGMPGRDIARAIRDGAAAGQIAAATRSAILADPPREVRNAVCAPGCAFCCVLTDADGGTISTAEARAVHAALAPFAGQPDGRDWMPAACPALDPETRRCRIYDRRPGICRSYVSTDAAACEVNAQGGAAPGGGVIGSHIDQLALLAFGRAALQGLAPASTHALRDVASAALAGLPEEKALDASRHPPVMLARVLVGAGRGPQ